MSKPALLLLLFCLTSCSKPKETFCIDGCIGSMTDGDTLVIAHSPDGIVLEELSCTVVKDGRIHTQGTADCVEPAWLCHNAPNNNNSTLFFIEKGDITVVADSSGYRITGTPLNDLHNSIKDTIISYLDRLEELEQLYYSKELSEEQLAHLSTHGLCMQERLVGYLRNVARENIHTPLGLYLLVVYNTLFTTQELCELEKLVPPSIIKGCNIPFYTALTDIIEERNK